MNGWGTKARSNLLALTNILLFVQAISALERDDGLVAHWLIKFAISIPSRGIRPPLQELYFLNTKSHPTHEGFAEAIGGLQLNCQGCVRADISSRREDSYTRPQ
ncbi:MAG: hypothetical protein R3F19_00835 [Verrucomicrobiales bacterium]